MQNNAFEKVARKLNLEGKTISKWGRMFARGFIPKVKGGNPCFLDDIGVKEVQEIAKMKRDYQNSV